VVTGHEITGGVPVPENAVSVTVTPVRSTLPVLVTSKLYVTRSPATLTDVGVTDLTSVSAGPAGMVTTAVAGGEVTTGPDGGVPDTVAVFLTCPAFTSACVTVYVAVHVVDAPGANVVTGHETTGGGPARTNVISLTVSPVRVTLPVLVTRKLYVTCSPAAPTEVGDTDLTSVSAGPAPMVTTAVAGGEVTAGPDGGVPDTVAVFVTSPAFTSACVTVYVAVHVVDPSGANVVTGHEITGGVPVPENAVSVTATPVRLRLPVLVTTKL
jgi:hypothetical protein